MIAVGLLVEGRERLRQMQMAMGWMGCKEASLSHVLEWMFLALASRARRFQDAVLAGWMASAAGFYGAAKDAGWFC